MERKVDKIFMLGDTHGDFKTLTTYLKNLSKLYFDKKVIVIQLGDFCFWPEVARLEDIKVPKNVEVFACPGNHENWDYLDQFGYTPTEVTTRVWYMPFGSTLTLNDKVFMFCGGADSIDKDWRTPKISWWEQEVISYRDIEELKEPYVAHVVVSHVAPNFFNFSHYKNTPNYKDPSRDALDTVWNLYKPRYWFCGHYHKFIEGNFEGTQWTILGDLNSPICTKEFIDDYRTED